MEILTYQNIILLVATVLNLAMSIFIISRGWKNKINLYFSLFTFFTFVWSLSVIFWGVIENDNWFFWIQLAYPAALGIIVSLFYFSIWFPYKFPRYPFWFNFFVLIPSVLIITLVYSDGLFITDVTKDFDSRTYTLFYNKPMYIFFAVYFLILSILLIYNLVIKYINSEETLKRQAGVLMTCIIIGLSMGIFFDLILPYFENFHYVWVGPIFTLLMNAAVFYLIFLHKKKIITS